MYLLLGSGAWPYGRWCVLLWTSVSAVRAALWQVLIPDVIDEVAQVFTPPVVRLRSRTPLVEAAWTLAVMWSNSTSNFTFICYLLLINSAMISEIFQRPVSRPLLWFWRETWRKLLRLFSSLPEQVVVVRASGRPPGCRFLRDPPSFIEKAERKIHVMSRLQTECVTITDADRVREGSATCDAEEKVTQQTITNQHLQELRGPDRHASK